ncbi:MAG: hypothetical protein ACU85V_00080 [Gammaproteobacteria bacterium]
MPTLITRPAFSELDRCYIGSRNVVQEGALTASSEDADKPATNVASFNVADHWLATGTGIVTLTLTLPRALRCGIWGAAGHNLENGGAVELQSSTDGQTFTTISAQAPAYRHSFARAFDSVLARWWRLRFVVARAPRLGLWWLGPAIQMPQAPAPGFEPPHHAPDNKVLNNDVQGGNFLGRSLLRVGGRTSMRWPSVPMAWYEDNWRPLLDHMQTKPVALVWDSTKPHDGAICQSMNAPKAATLSSGFAGLALDVTLI